ncbi:MULTISPECIES: hypothetical protein [Paraburkholderia]|uniref:hypothetical protein n=1 Tax=Paraburkholderia TaxID=1822464 RepID=UPI0000E7959A
MCCARTWRGSARPRRSASRRRAPSWGRTETALDQRTAALLAAQVEVRELEKAQAEGHAARQAMEADLVRLKSEALARDLELEQVRDGFSRDLDRLRETAAQSGERLRATEKRALLEIDRERGAAARLQKEVDETTKRAEKRDADHRRAIETLQAQLGDARHQAGVLQGRLDAAQATNVTLQQQLAASRHAETLRTNPRPAGSRKGRCSFRHGASRGAPPGARAPRPIRARQQDGRTP